VGEQDSSLLKRGVGACYRRKEREFAAEKKLQGRDLGLKERYARCRGIAS